VKKRWQCQTKLLLVNQDLRLFQLVGGHCSLNTFLNYGINGLYLQREERKVSTSLEGEEKTSQVGFL
jgi:hypothetical protein